MRTLTLHTADELVERWRRRAMELSDPDYAPCQPASYEDGMAQGYRVAAAELLAILAASMEMEAAHHGDPEPLLTSPPGTGWTGRPGDCRICGVGLPQHHFQCPVPEADMTWKCRAAGPEAGQMCDLSVGHDGPHVKAPPYGATWARVPENESEARYDARGNLHGNPNVRLILHPDDPNALREWLAGERP